MGRLEGKVAVVTGAGSGIGLAMVKRFAAEGASVVGGEVVYARLADIDAVPGATAVHCDVSDCASVRELIEAAVRGPGAIDVLCNNAGIFGRFKTVDETTDEEWERELGVNLTGTFLCTREALGHMRAAGRGMIINTASIAGLAGGIDGAAYTASKHGVIGLTKSTAVAYGKDGVRCVAICPGGVVTGITDEFERALAAGEVSRRGLEILKRTSGAALRRAQAEEIAALALFLASDEASVLNGAIIQADSGWLAH
jgi:NAD(P)-dependent dehydrogenase (short-subunit alcohol dehydrogenase family)